MKNKIEFTERAKNQIKKITDDRSNKSFLEYLLKAVDVLVLSTVSLLMNRLVKKIFFLEKL